MHKTCNSRAHLILETMVGMIVIINTIGVKQVPSVFKFVVVLIVFVKFVKLVCYCTERVPSMMLSVIVGKVVTRFMALPALSLTCFCVRCCDGCDREVLR